MKQFHRILLVSTIKRIMRSQKGPTTLKDNIKKKYFKSLWYAILSNEFLRKMNVLMFCNRFVEIKMHPTSTILIFYIKS